MAGLLSAMSGLAWVALGSPSARAGDADQPQHDDPAGSSIVRVPEDGAPHPLALPQEGWREAR